MASSVDRRVPGCPRCHHLASCRRPLALPQPNLPGRPRGTAGCRRCRSCPTRRPLPPPLAAVAGFIIVVARLLQACTGLRSVPGRVLIAISSLSIPAIFGRHSSITSTGATTTYSRTSVALPRTPPSSSPAGIDRFSAGRRSPAAGPDCPHVDGLLPVLLRPDRPPGELSRNTLDLPVPSPAVLLAAPPGMRPRHRIGPSAALPHAAGLPGAAPRYAPASRGPTWPCWLTSRLSCRRPKPLSRAPAMATADPCVLRG